MYYRALCCSVLYSIQQWCIKECFCYDCLLQSCPLLRPPRWLPWLLEDRLLLEDPCLPSPHGLLLLPKVAKEQSEWFKNGCSGGGEREKLRRKFVSKMNSRALLENRPLRGRLPRRLPPESERRKRCVRNPERKCLLWKEQHHTICMQNISLPSRQQHRAVRSSPLDRSDPERRSQHYFKEIKTTARLNEDV